MGPFDRVDVVDNHVRRFDDPDRFEEGPSCGVHVVGGPRRRTDATVRASALNTVRGSFQFLAIGNRYVVVEVDDGRLNDVLPVGLDVVGVRGNVVEGSGTRPLVDVSVAGHATLGENRCLVGDERLPVAAVELSGASMVVNANYVETQPEAVGMNLQSPQGSGTVLGNLSNGRIDWNGADIHTIAPWGELNPTL